MPSPPANESDSAALKIFSTKFRMEADEKGLRSQPGITAENADGYVNKIKNWLESCDCGSFQNAKIDKNLIREIRPRVALGGEVKRLRFQTAQAAEAFSEVQRVCKANP